MPAQQGQFEQQHPLHKQLTKRAYILMIYNTTWHNTCLHDLNIKTHTISISCSVAAHSTTYLGENIKQIMSTNDDIFSITLTSTSFSHTTNTTNSCRRIVGGV